MVEKGRENGDADALVFHGKRDQVMLTPTPTPSPAILDIIHDGKVCISQAVCDIDEFWKYRPSGDGWFESHNLRQIADLLDGLNAPYEKELFEFFDKLPKEIDQAVRHDDTPF